MQIYKVENIGESFVIKVLSYFHQNSSPWSYLYFTNNYPSCSYEDAVKFKTESEAKEYASRLI